MAADGGTTTDLSLAGGKTPPASREAMIDECLSDLDDLDLSEAQARELLAALYDIMHSFVLIGFGLDSVQSVLPMVFRNVSLTKPDAVLSQDNQTTDKDKTDRRSRAGEDGFE